ncbi:MAG TPA: hypothetical protein PKY95_08255 [candidate division Zixibacteria bacterium]|nr:hypothetical protein [candidate division Zixibacteria bacterium]
MSTRFKEILVLTVLAAAAVIVYLGRGAGRLGAVSFSPLVSTIIMVLIGLALLYILVRTIRGRLVDRRIVFLFVGLAVLLPLFMSLEQRMTISPEVRQVYDAVGELPAGSRVLVSFDYDPASAPELQPMAEAFLYLAFQRDLKVVIMGLWPQGPQQANQALAKVLARPEIAAKHLEYGVDYLNFGYQVGNEFVIQRMGSSFQSMFPRDMSGRAYGDLPLVRNVKNFSNVDYAFNLSAGYPGTQEWVLVAVGKFGLRMGAGNTAVQAPQMYPYWNTGQLIGLMGGMSGAAQFELLAGYEGKGTRYMLSQSFAHIVVIGFILIGNAAFFLGGRKPQRKG